MDRVKAKDAAEIKAQDVVQDGVAQDASLWGIDLRIRLIQTWKKNNHESVPQRYGWWVIKKIGSDMGQEIHPYLEVTNKERDLISLSRRYDIFEDQQRLKKVSPFTLALSWCC